MMGPILFARGASAESTALSALMVLAEGQAPAPLHPMHGEAVAPECLHREAGHAVWRYTFALPARDDAAYTLDGATYPVAADLSGDVRVAYVSCNGQEAGDLDRPDGERNALWHRLTAEHADRPFHLLLHGGDQIYADEVWDAHPELRAWSDDRAGAHPPLSGEADAAASAFYLTRYRDLYAQPAVARMLARVPSLMMWDDHDIFDGWGSHDDGVLDDAVACRIYGIARTHFRLFQMGVGASEQPQACPVDASRSLGFRVPFPGFDVLAPDLRSERRPDRVMDADGWRMLTDALAPADAPPRRLLLSSVPALGPRLSLLERVLHLVPHVRKYEDDLRDQWQSRSHRGEWTAFLRALTDRIADAGEAVTVLSGEIHLATRGEMRVGPARLHQLVASGIAHPPPPSAWARTLDVLAWLGENPVPERPIRMRPLPGRRGIYLADRNFLVLERAGGDWSARWYTERRGWTPALEI